MKRKDPSIHAPDDEVKKKKHTVKSFSNIYHLQRCRFEAAWEAQLSVKATKTLFSVYEKDIEKIRQTSIEQELLAPLNTAATKLMKANKSGNVQEKDQYVRELIIIIKTIVEKEKAIALKILDIKNCIEQHNKKLLVKQRVLRICLFGIREANVFINKSSIEHGFDALRIDRKFKKYAPQDNNDIQEEEEDEEDTRDPENTYNNDFMKSEMLPEDILNGMDIKVVSKQIAENETPAETRQPASATSNIETITHSKADIDFVKRVNPDNLTTEDKTKGVKVFNECKRHLKTMSDMCSAVAKRAAQIYEDHEAFVTSFKEYIKY